MGRRASPPTTMVGKLFSSIATTLGFPGWGGGYSALDPRRKLIDPRALFMANRQTANQILSQSLPVLRAHCRHLSRNNPTARAAEEALVALIVGTGIDLVPDTGDRAIDAKIRKEWAELRDNCDVDGRDLYTIQQETCRGMVVTGEGLWRFIVDPELSGRGNVPVRILPLESEWLADDIPPPGVNSITAVSGVAMDRYGRAVAYGLSNPAGGAVEWVDADSISLIFERRRSLQARGEPWMCAVIETLMNERDLVDAELYAAKQSAAMALVITSDFHGDLDTDENGTPDDPAAIVRIGGVARLNPGEDIKSFSHTRPSQQIAPFRQMLRGDIAASLRIPQRFLDRDVSRANYSSMRADMLDTERLLAPVREWFGHQTAGRLYKKALPFLALRAGVKLPRAKYRLVPDVQPYVDPEKDIRAKVMAITAGLSNYETEIGKQGGEWDQIWQQLKTEQDAAKSLGLSLNLSGSNAPAPASTIGADPAADPAADAAAALPDQPPTP